MNNKCTKSTFLSKYAVLVVVMSELQVCCLIY